jgi:hypothetical protein
MANQHSLPPPLRDGAQRAELYNDGLVVYLYDLSFRESLKSDNAWDQVNAAFDAEKPDKALKQFLNSQRLAAYELQQDDEVLADVVVGPPLTSAELKSRKGVKWFKAQTTLLKVPTGALRVECANSCEIGPEEPTDPGATLKVPPGDYLLSLYRIDWAAMKEADSNPPKVVGETIVLTPLADATPPKTYSALMRFPVKKSKTSWVGAYTIEGNTFKGQVFFADHWEFMTLNLDRDAFAKMGLGIGSVLDVEVLGRTFAVVYLGDAIQFGVMQLAFYKQLFGRDRMTAEIARETEVALGAFFKPPDVDREVLCCMRVNAKESWIEGKTEKWLKVSATARPQKLTAFDRADFGKWKQDGNALHATVLLRSDKYMTLNLDTRALEAIGVKPGDTITIKSGGSEQRALFAGTPVEMGKAISARSELTGEAREAYMNLRVKLLGASESDAPAILAQLRAAFTGDPPLVACFDKYWLDREQTIFLITTMAADKAMLKLTFEIEIPAKPGDTVVVAKG